MLSNEQGWIFKYQRFTKLKLQNSTKEYYSKRIPNFIRVNLCERGVYLSKHFVIKVSFTFNE